MKLSRKLETRFLTDGLKLEAIFTVKEYEELLEANAKIGDIQWKDGPRAMRKKEKVLAETRKLVNSWGGGTSF